MYDRWEGGSYQAARQRIRERLDGTAALKSLEETRLNIEKLDVLIGLKNEPCKLVGLCIHCGRICLFAPGGNLCPKCRSSLVK